MNAIAWIIAGLAIATATVLWIVVHGVKRASQIELSNKDLEKITRAEFKAAVAEAKKAREIENAPLSQKIDRARILRDIGKLRGEDKPN